MKFWLKKYLIRIFIINFFSLLYLIETPVFDNGFFSIQSIIYSINIHLLYFFILFETLIAYLSLYGLDFSFYKLIINYLNNLNYEYILFIFYQNINFLYFLIFSIGFLIFLEKTKYNLDFKKKPFNFKKIILITAVFIIFILTNFNPNYTNLALVDKYKGLKETKDLYKWGVYYRPINDIFYKDNITVIGDAAHPIVPFLGQGGCLALEDGYALGKLFAHHKNSFNEAQIQYKNIRNKRVQNINKSSLMQAKLNHFQNPVLVFIRNLLMKYTNIISIRTRNIWEYDIRKEIKKLLF